jgi:hypothetical protein
LRKRVIHPDNLKAKSESQGKNESAEVTMSSDQISQKPERQPHSDALGLIPLTHDSMNQIGDETWEPVPAPPQTQKVLASPKLPDHLFLTSESMPSHIGAYHLLKKMGEGGMGVVYLAEQMYPIRRQVALKIIKLGRDRKQVIARFEAERQALALMDHPVKEQHQSKMKPMR